MIDKIKKWLMREEIIEMHLPSQVNTVEVERALRMLALQFGARVGDSRVSGHELSRTFIEIADDLDYSRARG